MTTMKPCPKCHSTEHLHIEIIDDNLTASRSVKAGCTECHTFAQIDYVFTGPLANECRPDDVQLTRDGMSIATTGKEYLIMSEIKLKPILSPSIELWKSDSPAAKTTNAIVANVMAGFKESLVPVVRGVKREATAIGYTPDSDSVMCRRIDNDGHASIECPNCGGQIDFHAGHIDNGRVFVCKKGKPLMREVRYHCPHCDSTIIFIEKCEPKGVDHD